MRNELDKHGLFFFSSAFVYEKKQSWLDTHPDQTRQQGMNAMLPSWAKPTRSQDFDDDDGHRLE